MKNFEAPTTAAVGSPVDLRLGPLPAKTVLDRHLPTGIALYGYTADQMRAYGSQERAVELERCAKIVEEYNPGGSYHIRTALAAEIRRA